MVKTLRSAEDIEAYLPQVLASPKDNGEVKMLIVRRGTNQREVRSEVYFSPEGGMEGDRWAKGASHDPEHLAQITIMNSRILDFIADGDEERMALAGDNIVVDLDLQDENLAYGQKLKMGEVVFEVTTQPHNGCKKFAERFGPQALKFINTPSRKYLHLRGIYLRVIEPGVVRTGDRIEKI